MKHDRMVSSLTIVRLIYLNLFGLVDRMCNKYLMIIDVVVEFHSLHTECVSNN